MAVETEVLKVKIDGTELAINSIKDAKKAIKDLNSEILAGNKDAAKSLAQVKDRLEDISDATQTLKGSGVEKLNGSLRLLSDGFNNFDTDKIKVAFQGIGSAMKAIPIFLVIEGFRLLYENFDKVIALFKTGEDQIKSLTASLNEQKKASQEAAAQYERDAALLAAAGEKNSEVIKKQIEAGEAQVVALDAQLLTLYKQLELVEREGEKYKEILKEIDEVEASRYRTVTQTAAAILNRDKALASEAKAELDAAKKELDKIKAAREKLNQSLSGTFDANDPELAAEEKRFEATQALNDQILANKERLAKEEVRLTAEKVRLETELEKRAAEDAARIAKEKSAVKIQTEKSFVDGAKGLSNAFFQFQINAAKGNAKDLNDLAKKKFEVDKAFNIAQATMEGIRSVTGTLAATAKYGPEIQIPAGIAAGIAAAAQVALIAATQFEGAATDIASAGTPSASISSPSLPAPPVFSGNNTEQTILETDGNGRTSVRAYVVETDISSTQRLIQRIQEQSTFK